MVTKLGAEFDLDPAVHPYGFGAKRSRSLEQKV